MSSVSLPPGFIKRHVQGVTWWVKDGWEEALSLCCDTDSPARQPVVNQRGGRGTLYRLSLGTRGVALVRPYQRGGFVRHFVRDLYWDAPPRPFAELLCTETARRRGVPTVEVLAAGVERARLGLYRGLLVSREAEGYVNLWEWLQGEPSGAERERIITAAAHTIARLHRAGIEHADLNLTNLLVSPQTRDPSALVIDFDRARVYPAPLPERQRQQNLRRLQRSLKKLDPNGVLASACDAANFCQAYRVGLR
jgi:3-deoxy-D-manno-octulosonic acid kinase